MLASVSNDEQVPGGRIADQQVGPAPGNPGPNGPVTPPTDPAPPPVAAPAVSSGAPTGSAVPWVSIAAAVAILMMFALLFNFMLGQVRDTTPEAWDRYLLLYNSVQTIVVAAASALLGVQISASQTKAARVQATAAKEQVDRLASNVRSYQTDLAGIASSSEKGVVDPVIQRLTARAMLLLH